MLPTFIVPGVDLANAIRSRVVLTGDSGCTSTPMLNAPIVVTISKSRSVLYGKDLNIAALTALVLLSSISV